MSFISTELQHKLIHQYGNINRQAKELLDRIYASLNDAEITENPEYMEMQVDAIIQELHALRKRIVQ